MIPRIPIVHLDSEVPNQPLEILLQVRFHASTRFWIPMIPIAELDVDVPNQPLEILFQVRFEQMVVVVQIPRGNSFPCF